MARFDGVYALGYNSAGREAIWMKIGALRVYCYLPLVLARDTLPLVTCRITLNHLSTVAMRLMSNYFHHLLSLDAHIDSRTDTQALRTEYCIVDIPHNTAI